MFITKSLRAKLIIGVLIIIMPLVTFLFYNNHYASNVVREQVAESYSSLLSLHKGLTDQKLRNINNYLYKSVFQDPDINILHAHPYSSDSYVLIKQRIINKFQDDINYYDIVDTFYVYHKGYDDLSIFTHRDYSNRLQNIQDSLPLLSDIDSHILAMNWMIVASTEGYALTTLAHVNQDIAIGVWIDINNIVEQFGLSETDDDIGFLILANNEAIFTTRNLPSLDGAGVLQLMANMDQPYQTLSEEANQYLMVGTESSAADMMYFVVVPEHNILKSLPFFQRMVYVIPVTAFILLGIYLFYLRNVLDKPLVMIMNGMKRISHGSLDYRLKETGSIELNYLIKTFNEMASQIQNLKIDVYEEKIRVQDAKFKHLQVQINPHFYLNSLNIVYHLAALKDFSTIQRLALNLADHFRFMIRIKRNFISLGEEVKHVQNYLNIQELRYPENIVCQIKLAKEEEDIPIPPLSIQPFVENCIVHGFTDRNKKFIIFVDVHRSREDASVVEIVIQDNGKGFSTEMLERLNSGRYFKEVEGQDQDHLGIWNIHQRVMIAYRKKAELIFENGEEGGAKIVLKLPISLEEKEEL